MKKNELKKEHRDNYDRTFHRIMCIHDINVTSRLIAILKLHEKYNQRNANAIYEINIIIDGLELMEVAE